MDYMSHMPVPKRGKYYKRDSVLKTSLEGKSVSSR